tara:strand:+ start:458 stop:568 length:111 start_codon:yes stop_codon:yes gene_type:complete
MKEETRKTKQNHKNNPEISEEIIKLEKLYPSKAMIK